MTTSRLAALFCAVLAMATTSPAQDVINGYRPKWWKEAVVYQIYPRSFKDSNGDGIGDLKGITSKLDYLKDLGVDVIWLSPHFDSPNADNGYDIRDYRKVMSEFGTMTDFDEMLKGIKQRHMKLLLDLVVNHTSDEHAWFVESRKSKDNSYRDYYIWRPSKLSAQGGGCEPPNEHIACDSWLIGPPNNWTSFFSGSAWKMDDATHEYYLHLFAEKQPDLNWDNPKVRHEVYDLMKFWLDKGVDGFRIDVIPFISKDLAFPDYPKEFEGRVQYFYANGPKVHDYIQEMNREVLSKYDVMTVGEAFGVSLEQTPLLVDERRNELNMIFNFDVVRLGRQSWRQNPWTLPELKAVYTNLDQKLDAHNWGTVFLSNHDNPRVVSRFGDDSPQFRVASAKALATMLLTLKGTPFIYQGDELSMTNYPFTKIEDFNDIEVKNAWKAEVLTHKATVEDYIASLRKTSRDNSRTPMQWDSSANGGFTTATKAWLAVNPNLKEINAQQAVADPNSVYHYFQKLIALRKKTPALIYGDYKDIDPQHPQVFAYTRTLGALRYLVVLNLSSQPVTYIVPGNQKVGLPLLTNLPGKESSTSVLRLRPWDARIYQL